MFSHPAADAQAVDRARQMDQLRLDSRASSRATRGAESPSEAAEPPEQATLLQRVLAAVSKRENTEARERRAKGPPHLRSHATQYLGGIALAAVVVVALLVELTARPAAPPADVQPRAAHRPCLPRSLEVVQPLRCAAPPLTPRRALWRAQQRRAPAATLKPGFERRWRCAARRRARQVKSWFRR